jgi:hypothetical protein
MSEPRSSRPEASDPEDLPEPPRIRALRRLVTTLTVVLILGMVTIAVTLVLRITRTPAPAPAPASVLWPDRIALPVGERITASGFGQGLLMLVTEDEAGAARLRLYDPETGALQHVVAIERNGP